jgi:predicted NAD/FAD-binding protein
MKRLRRECAGVDSFGNVWPTDGAVIDVPDDQAIELLRIPDSGITEVFRGVMFSEVVATPLIDETVRPQRRPPVKGR